ncbi:MAG: 3-dehydroquinate synthase [Candidatus Eremiobacteraeota bacterium]|nr:3-dehydroquinate synthase [Candidatus Eremiobacteraeota bacterium]
MILNTDLPYPVAIGDAAITGLPSFIREHDYRRFVVLADENVARYADDATRRVRGRIALESFALGETRKRMRTVEMVLERLVAMGADRDTLIVGVGGGVASDVFGFAAALFMRGVPYVHVATSLVAMVDAAVGGKTGVDLASGKNLAGIFSDPLAVFCDTATLRTLPFRHLREGLAEMVKHGIIEGGEVFESLEVLSAHPFHKWPWENVVADSLQVKTMIVNDDRMEHGARETLNLGHTFAHAIEHSSGYAVSHGAAVSVGLRAAGLLALELGRFSQSDHLRVLTVLALLKMPMRTLQSPVAIRAAMQTDKKRRDGRLRFVLPNAIGDVEYGLQASDRALNAVLARCTAVPGAKEFR